MMVKIARVILTISLLVLSPYCQPAESSQAEEMLRLINQERVKRKLPELHLDASLNRAAARHSREMAQGGRLSHQLAGETPLVQRAAQAGAAFDAVGENVAHSESIAGAHEDFMYSSGHRANILDPRYNAVGIGAEESRGMLYVTEDFARLQNKFSAADFTAAVLAKVDGWRRQAGLAPLAHMDPSSLQLNTCQPQMTAQTMSDSVPGAAWTVVFTTSNPDQLPDELKKIARGARARSIAVAACRVQPDSFATFEVAAVFFR
jgi:uncharacterized protein YkwD